MVAYSDSQSPQLSLVLHWAGYCTKIREVIIPVSNSLQCKLNTNVKSNEKVGI